MKPAASRKLAIRLVTEAKKEMRAAARWYNLRQPGLGDEFIEEVDRTLERIAQNPQQFPYWEDGQPYQRAQMKRFPYSAVFRVKGTQPQVLAIAHQHRKPGYWLERDPSGTA